MNRFPRSFWFWLAVGMAVSGAVISIGTRMNPGRQAALEAAWFTGWLGIVGLAFIVRSFVR
jgi:hypothetical protein